MRHDLRDALRALRRAPAFSLVAIVTLALAIGSATSVFSVVDAVVLRALPYHDTDRLHPIYEAADQTNFRVPSYPTFKDWQSRSASLRDVIEGMAFVRGNGVSLQGVADDERQIDAYVTPRFFDLMGTRPLLGRGFRPDEEAPGGPAVAVISYAFFLKEFGGDHSIVGKKVSVDSMPTTIIGVMPRGFAYPNFGSGGWLPPALWQPLEFIAPATKALTLRGLHVDSRTILRLRPGVDSARAATAMRTIVQGLALEYPVEQAHWTSVVMPSLSSELFGPLWSTLALIAASVALIMLLACANVANLLLVRTSVRARELAVRAALGASTWQLARGLLAEASVIAIAAAATGLGLAMSIVHYLRPFAAARLPFATSIAIDARAAFFAAGAAVATALLVGVLPALHATRGSLVGRLRGGAADASVATRRARNVLVSVQCALAVTVLVGAGLLIQSVRRVSSVELGFDSHDVASFAIAPPKGRYTTPAEAAALYKRILDAALAIPRVEMSAAAGGALLQTKVETDGHASSSTPVTALAHPVSTDFLKLLRIRLVAGRGFTDDDMRSPTGLLVNETLAKQLWPSASAIGNRITIFRGSQGRADFGQPITLPVVGVVADYHEYGPEAKPPTQVFLPYTLEVWPWMRFVVRAPDPTAIFAPLTAAIKNVEPGITYFSKPSVDDSGLGRRTLADPRMFVAALMGAFAFTALVVAAIGLYGIIAYGVAQRTREIGIRIAIGATPGGIIALVLRHAAALVVAGVGGGLLVAAGVTRLIQSMLFETTTTDVATFVLVPVVLVVVATIASLIPAYRAAAVDPLIAIRTE